MSTTARRTLRPYGMGVLYQGVSCALVLESYRGAVRVMSVIGNGESTPETLFNLINLMNMSERKARLKPVRLATRKK